jgi:hypothetical protein
MEKKRGYSLNLNIGETWSQDANFSPFRMKSKNSLTAFSYRSLASKVECPAHADVVRGDGSQRRITTSRFKQLLSSCESF